MVTEEMINKISQGAEASSRLSLFLDGMDKHRYKVLDRELLTIVQKLENEQDTLKEALGHIENLLDCINDARQSTIPPITDGEQLCTISFGYAEKIKSANEFLKGYKNGS